MFQSHKKRICVHVCDLRLKNHNKMAVFMTYLSALEVPNFRCQFFREIALNSSLVL